jgi:hypothetical protein
MKVVLSFDIDWVKDEILADTFEILRNYRNVNATFFATHNSIELKKSEFEIGIHPNFNDILEGNSKDSFSRRIDTLLDLYPSSKGFRAHSLTNSSAIYSYILSKGLKYESNVLLPYSANLELLKYPPGLVRIPFNFEDDVHFGFGKPFNLDATSFHKSNLNIFNFHPIHIYLNTCSNSHYESSKDFYQDPKRLISKRNHEILGARDLLVSVLDFCEENSINIISLFDLYEEVYDI